ncbi:MAG TPA: tRNA preQ1(34) S-adenosylmethionine ribosyltransferase-isomerase QueA [Gemmatimonadales bacterium]|nr:tRNA preQ1(34) S-adenosylmethionine ribosyltransferase-isomerase QueA [Gemmatimonadales bacterium]
MHRTSDFDYTLPSDLIAQEPLAERSASRLLVLDRASGAITHRRFTDLPDLVAPADVLVLNASRVIPARLRGVREHGGPAELLIVEQRPDGDWLALGHPGGKLKPGRTVRVGPDSAIEVVEILGGGLRRIRFVGALDGRATLARYGLAPLPPYIHHTPSVDDRERYQTVYAEHDGSIAAPTAGLHFTTTLLDQLRGRGTAVAMLELHVGLGTFKPVRVEDLEAHPMHAERYAVSAAAAQAINQRHGLGGRRWAVGTTTVRTLETVVDAAGRVAARSGETALFIRPPYVFRAVDALITNFHLPRSTLLMLVCAFGGYETVMRAYQEAIRERYRFYSYGDAMAIL